MDFIIDFILNIDQHMVEVVNQYHIWTYAILFLIIFCETGLVVTPFLPGDSLLFVTGAIAALPGSPLNIHLLVLIVFAAAFLGDSCNYAIGHFFGRRLFSNPDSKIFKQSYLTKTQDFYDHFISFNAIGGALWVTIFCYIGFFFGDLPFVQENLKLLIVAIILISVLPAVIEAMRARLKSRKAAA